MVELRKLELDMQKSGTEAELAVRGDTNKQFERMRSQFGWNNTSLSVMMKYLTSSSIRQPELVVPALRKILRPNHTASW